ncbi:MAG: NIPSNAP family protein [Planctomycetaceae bacterium]|nr:NIPSNAP family protein [Planctomycetaceae bacterium]
MERRDFLKTACATGAMATVATGTALAQPTAGSRSNRAFIEFREYHCATAEKKQLLIAILDRAMIPALNRQEITPVGVFETSAELNAGDRNYDAANNLKVYLLCQYGNMRQLTAAPSRLLADEAFMSAATDVFEAPMNEPVYETCESTLMYGFPNCPRIEVPTLEASRLLQIRFYKSYNIDRNAAKIAMFDTDGELELFRKYGMSPVFFGETLAGRMMPNLTYMLGFKNTEEKDAAWSKFASSPEWKELSGNPKYKDTANKIINIVLKPSPKSQV